MLLRVINGGNDIASLNHLNRLIDHRKRRDEPLMWIVGAPIDPNLRHIQPTPANTLCKRFSNAEERKL